MKVAQMRLGLGQKWMLNFGLPLWKLEEGRAKCRPTNKHLVYFWWCAAKTYVWVIGGPVSIKTAKTARVFDKTSGNLTSPNSKSIMTQFTLYLHTSLCWACYCYATLEARRLTADLIFCYKIINGLVSLDPADFFLFFVIQRPEAISINL